MTNTKWTWAGLRFLAILVLFAGAALTVRAQQITGSINGTVTDGSGAAVSGASLELTDLGTAQERTANSSAQGYFNFVDLPPKAYRLKISAPAFKEYIYESLRLAVGQQMSLQPILVLGAVSQSVEVTGDPPPVSITTASVGQLIETKQIDNLPLNGRNALNLVLLVPGALPAASQAPEAGACWRG